MPDPQRLEIGPPVGDAAAAHAQSWRGRVEHGRDPGSSRRARRSRGRHERGRCSSAGCWPSESIVSACVKPWPAPLQSVQHRCALAAVVRQAAARAGRSSARRQRPQAGVAAVGAAVHHHPDRSPASARVANGLDQSGAGIVARDDDEPGTGEAGLPPAHAARGSSGGSSRAEIGRSQLGDERMDSPCTTKRRPSRAR